jgi:hypothetical protein
MEHPEALQVIEVFNKIAGKPETAANPFSALALNQPVVVESLENVLKADSIVPGFDIVNPSLANATSLVPG